MSSNSDVCSSDENQEVISDTSWTREKESLQYIVFDFRNSPSQPVRGRLLQVNKAQEQVTNHEFVLADELNDKRLGALVLSSSGMESLFGKRNIHSNHILKYAKITFINDSKLHTNQQKLIYSDRLTKYGTCMSDEECPLEDATDLMAFTISPSSYLKAVLGMAQTFYRQTDILAFHKKQKLSSDQTIQSQLNQEVSMIHLLLQKPMQLPIINPLEFNRFETLLVECSNTDTYTELKYKVISQFPDRNFQRSKLRITQGFEEKEGEECLMTLMKEVKTDNECNVPSMLRYPSKKFSLQLDLFLHRAPIYYRKVIINHPSKKLSVFVNSQWSTAELREEIAKVTQCYPKSLNLLQMFSGGIEQPIPETFPIDHYVTENAIIRTGIREKVELVVVVKDQSRMKKFIIFMFDLNTTDDLRLDLSTHLDVDSFYIDLFHANSVLPSSSFKNLGFRRKEEIHVEVQRRRIRIKLFDINQLKRRKEWMIIDDPEVSTVQDLLAFWAVQCVCEESNLGIIFENRSLSGSISLMDAKIYDGSSIFVCHKPSAPDATTVPGRYEGIFEAKYTGEMRLRHGVIIEGIACYSHPEHNYDENIRRLKKQRLDELRTRKLRPGIRLDSSYNLALKEGAVMVPQPSTPKLIPFPSLHNKKSGDASPTIHAAEYYMISPRNRGTKRKIDFSESEKVQKTQESSLNEQRQEYICNVADDNVSCKTFPIKRSKRRNPVQIDGTKKKRLFDEQLPDFNTLLEPYTGGKDISPTYETDVEEKTKQQRKKAHSISEGDDLTLLSKTFESAKLVKQYSNTTKYYSCPGASGLLRANSHTSFDYISNGEQMNITSVHGSPKLVEIESHSGTCTVNTDDRPCSSTVKGIPEKTLHEVSKLVSCPWKILARELGLESPAINKIEERPGNDCLEEKINQTLLTWKQKVGSRASLKELAECFHNLEQNETAEKIHAMMINK